MKPNIGLSEPQRQRVLDVLAPLLADEFVLYAKTRSFHWNITGFHFAQMHALFEAQYEALDEVIDEVAERSRALGGMVAGTLGAYLERTRLEQRPEKRRSENDMLLELLEDHESIVRSLRRDIEVASEAQDEGTSDFMTGLMEQHEKTAWILRSHLDH